MSFGKRLMQVDISGGLDTKTDPKQVLRGSLAVLENGVFNQGSVIRKRNGYLALPKTVAGSADLNQAESIGTYGDELIMLSESRLLSHAVNRAAWLDKGGYSSARVGRRDLLRNSHQQSNPDLATMPGTALHVWEDARGGVRAAVEDLATGTRLIGDMEINAAGVLPRALAVGGASPAMFVLHAVGTALKARCWDPESALEFKAEVTLATDLDAANPLFDAVAFGSYAVFAYRNGGGGLTVWHMTRNGAVGSPLLGLAAPVVFAETPLNCLALRISAAGGAIFAAWHSGVNGLRAMALKTDLSVKSGPVTVDAATSPVVRNVTLIQEEAQGVPGDLKVFYELAAASASNRLVKACSIADPESAATVGTAPVLRRSVGLAARAFLKDGRARVATVHESTLQSTQFLMTGEGILEAKALPGISGGGNSKPRLSDAALATWDGGPAAGRRCWAALERTRLVSRDGDLFTENGVVRVEMDYGGDAADSASSAAGTIAAREELGGILHLGGGFLQQYDGASVVEHGFHLFPEGLTAAPAASGGSMSDGLRQYCAVYEWVDNQGLKHFSAPGIPVSTTVSGGGGSGRVVLALPTLRLTAKQVKIGVYRTEDLGDVFYKVGEADNDPGADAVAFTDIAADSAILGNELLYTTGGLLEHGAPPAGTHLAAFKNRLFCLSSEDPRTLHYSKKRSGSEPVAFSPYLTMRLDGSGPADSSRSAVTALAAMDDKLVVFKENSLLFVSGDGPLATGEQNSFSEPQLIASDVGCANPSSLVLTPAGLMFKSGKGIYLLDRALQTHYVGAEVEGYNSLEITSAVLVQGTSMVRFGTRDGRCLNYDYHFRKWGVFTNHESCGAAMWRGRYCLARADGEVMREEPGHFRDGNAPIPMRIQTGWINLTGLQGFQRTYRAVLLGDHHSAHVLRVSVGYDYQGFNLDTYEYDHLAAQPSLAFGQEDYGDAAFGGGNGVYQARLHLSRQKCEAVRFQFEDVMNDVAGESFSLSSLQLEVGVKAGLVKLDQGAVAPAT